MERREVERENGEKKAHTPTQLGKEKKKPSLEALSPLRHHLPNPTAANDREGLAL